MKWTRRILLALVILALLVTALWWEENWRGQKIWEESCARLRAAGEPVEIADIIPPMIPDEENVAAAPIFAELFKAPSSYSGTTRLERISTQWTSKVPYGRGSIPRSRPVSPTNMVYLNYWAEFLRESFPAAAPCGPFRNTAEEILHHYALLEPEWQDIRDALKRGKCRWPVDYELGIEMRTPHLLCLHRLVVVDRGRIAALAAAGEVQSYVDHLVTLFELERCVGDRPQTLLAHLFGVTMALTTLQAWQDSLPLVEFSEPQLQQLQSQLARFSLRDVAWALRNERVFLMHTCTEASPSELLGVLEGSVGVPTRWPSWASRAERSMFNTVFRVRPRGWQVADLATLQESLHQISAGCIDPKRDCIVKVEVDGMADEALRISETLGWYTYTRHVLSESVSVQQRILIRTAHLLAVARCAFVWCAAERFRLRHGHLPRNQEELIPVFIKEPLLDPIDGRPLRFSIPNGDNLLVYSVGWDGVDDKGVRQRKTESGDYGWASEPMLLVDPHETRLWQEEDAEHADDVNSSSGRKKPSRPSKARRAP